jgi:hypothetical protein
MEPEDGVSGCGEDDNHLKVTLADLHSREGSKVSSSTLVTFIIGIISPNSLYSLSPPAEWDLVERHEREAVEREAVGMEEIGAQGPGGLERQA